jgi:hypothetical protein
MLTRSGLTTTNHAPGVTTKKTYGKPELRNVGSVRELTLGASGGNVLDATSSAGTPRGYLTFF